MSARVDGLGTAVAAIGQRLGPDHVAVPFDHRVGAAKFDRFLRIKRGVNSTKDDIGARGAGDFSDFIAAQGIGGVDADSYRIAGVNARRVDGERVSSTRMGSPNLGASPPPAHIANAG